MKGNVWNVFDYLTDSLTFIDGLNKTARVAKDGLNRIVTDLVKDKKNLKAVNKLISFDFSKIVGGLFLQVLLHKKMVKS